MDGNIYFGDELLPAVTEALARLRSEAVPARFLPNNPSESLAQYLDKLAVFGGSG